MSKTLSRAGADIVVTAAEERALLEELLESWPAPLERVLLVPPDITRLHSGAGSITAALFRLLEARGAEAHVLPALGTHREMTASERERLFGDLPAAAFRVHDWREGVEVLGEVPGEFVSRVSGGRVDYAIAAEVDRLIVEGDYDRIVSIGQVVPHEVVGMANHNKNIFVGTGGPDTIHKTHFLGAVAGIESLLGRAQSPVRDVLDYAEREFLGLDRVTYVLTVRARDAAGELVTRGLWAGEGKDGFEAAVKLSQEVNIELLPAPLAKVVVWLDPEEFRSTWLGNKAVYRTRLAMADAGELLVLAPGLVEFGEDPQIDRLIREFGYRTTPEILRFVEESPELASNLSAAAHLIHGSSEGRFRITYAPGPGGLSREEIESVGYASGDFASLEARYLRDGVEGDGWREVDGERFYFISNPALGLWALAETFRS